MARLARAMRKRAEKAAIKEMRTSELKEVATRSRMATVGDIQDMIQFAFQEYVEQLHARKLRVRLWRWLSAPAKQRWQAHQFKRAIQRAQKGAMISPRQVAAEQTEEEARARVATPDAAVDF